MIDTIFISNILINQFSVVNQINAKFILSPKQFTQIYKLL